jgi:hypothetical protein
VFIPVRRTVRRGSDADAPSPLLEINLSGHPTMIAMERRERPVLSVGDEPVFDRIEPTIVDVVIEIAFIADDLTN